MLLGAIVWSVLTWTSLGDVFPNVLGGFLAAGFGIVTGSLIPTRANRQYMEEWRAKNHDNVINAPLLPNANPVPASTMA